MARGLRSVVSKWCGLIGLVLWLGGTVAAILATFSGVTRRPIELRLADGTPIRGTLYCCGSAEQRAPAAVVLHGTALAHASCAPGLAVPLARSGVVVLAIDLRGHGCSGGSVPRQEFDDLEAMLSSFADQPEVDAAIDFLKAQPFVSADRIALVGHSRGGWAAASVGYRRADVGSVVAINCAPATCDSTRPPNFLLLAAAGDGVIPLKDCFASMARATAGAVREPEVLIGDFQVGSARLLIVSYWSNHLSQLADPSTTRRAVQWVGYSIARDLGIVPGDRLLIAVWAAVAASVGSIMAGSAALRFVASRLLWHPPFTGRNRVSPGLVPLFLVLLPAAPLGTFLGDQLPAGPVLFAGHAVIFLLAVSGLVVGVSLVGRSQGQGLPARGVLLLHARAVLLGVLAFALSLAFLLLTWGTTWLDLVPTPRRAVLGLVLFPLILPSSLALAYGLRRLLGFPAANGWQTAMAGLAWLGIAVALWVGHSVFVMERHPFLAVPVSLLTLGSLVALPLWLVPDRPGMSLARAVGHAGVTAWLLACHLPFVHGS